MKKYGRIKYKLSHPANRVNRRTGEHYGYGIRDKKKLRMYRKARDVVRAGWKDRKAGFHRKRYYLK